ncbi:MAG: FAD-dependent oxidoreductase [Chloroflexota bacterium]
MRLAVIGAGVAGLAAAYYVRHMTASGPRPDVTVYETEREVGGRAATRRDHGCAYDYGAQYLKTDSQAVERLVLTSLPRDALIDIKRDVWVFDRDGQIAPGDADQNSAPKWTYLDGVSRLSRHLAQGIEVRTGVRVGRLASRAGGGYQLQDDQGRVLGDADMVLVAIPAPRAAELIRRSELQDTAIQALTAALAQATYSQSLSVALGYDRRLPQQPYYALVNGDKQHDIAWLAFEHDKGPARVPPSQSVVIVQMSALYSHSHYEEPAAIVVPAVAAMASALLGEDLRTPAWSDLERWRYALPTRLADPAALDGVAPHLFFAGDYLRGARIHLAIESGLAAAARIVARGAAATR